MRSGLVTLLAMTLSLALWSSAHADHDKYQYKFPCYSPDACYVTKLDHGSGHALDFDPRGSAGLGSIPSAAQGTVTFVETMQDTCTWPGGSGYGNRVVVSDSHGRSVIYAHLSDVSVALDASLLQGDQVGTEGNTGYSEDCEPHLHWEPGNLPAYMNAVLVSNLTAGPTDYGGSNTSSAIGAYSQAGASLRNRYVSAGGWGVVGWTANLSGLSNGLNMRDNKSWGWMQDFKAHPNGLDGQTNSTLHVSKWNQSAAYHVDTVFWQEWAIGGTTLAGGRRPMSMALESRRPDCPGVPGGCVSYQRFHLGYVWMDSFTGRESVFCPDVTGVTQVDLTDTLEVLAWYGLVNPYFDIDGFGGQNDLTDALWTLDDFGEECYARP